jgi:hypothetical protein
MGRLFLLIQLGNEQIRFFPKSLREKYNQYDLRTAALQYSSPLSPGHGRADGRTSAGRSFLTF